MARQQQYDNNDKGVFGREDKRESDRHPSHSGRVNLSRATLKSLMAQFQDEGECTLYIKGWTTKKSGVLSLAVEAPVKYRDDAPPPRRGNDRPPARGNGRTPPRGNIADDDDDDANDDIPF